MEAVNMYNLQHIQQIYQSQIMTAPVQADNRMRETASEIPRFGDTLARAAEPVARKTTPAVESATDQKAIIPSELLRTMGGQAQAPQQAASHAQRAGITQLASQPAQPADGSGIAGRASSSYASVMSMAEGGADYKDPIHGTVFDIMF